MKTTVFTITISLWLIIANNILAQWSSNGTNIYNSNSGNVSIGTTTSASKFHTAGNGGSDNNIASFTTSDFVYATTGSGLNISTGAGAGNTYTRISAVSAGFSAWNNLILQSGGGNVGIGTINPYAARLHIEKASINDVGGSFFLTNTATATIGNKTRLGFDLVGFDDIYPTASIDARLSATDGKTDLIFNVYDGSGTITNYERMRIVGSNGNVGIGTAAPQFLLSTEKNSAGSTVGMYVKNSGGNSPQTLTRFAVGMTPNEMSALLVQYDHNTDEAIVLNRKSTSGTLGLLTAGGGIRINNNGSVGIGTDNTGDYKLNVSGKIRANEIVVNTGGADFVFEPGYILPKLSETEKFIKENKRLPDIPSAREMQQSGMNVSEIQTKLLQKIEELTLYIIELEKENAHQNEEIAKLSKSR